jgi:polyhydroxyalkanoate synthesis regulator phasin
MGWSSALKKQVTDLSQKALERLMADEKRATRIANAIGSVQRGKAAFDRRQDELMRALNFAPRSEFKKLGKQLAGLKRRVRELDEKVSKLTDGRGPPTES